MPKIIKFPSYLLLIFSFWMCSKKPSTQNDTLGQRKQVKNQSKKEEEFSELEQKMINQGLVNIQSLDSTLMVELKYSTNDNFVKTDVYGSLTRAYLQKKPAEMLVQANKYLKEMYPNYRLLIYDGARPKSVQIKLWEMLDSIPPNKREDFVASPRIGSIHNYGSAVDLTIYDVEKKQPLDMGTKYDFFGDLAYPRYENQMLKTGKLTEQQVQNRLVLRIAMEKAGYMPIESEWWHFNAISRNKAKSIYKIVE